MPGRSCTLQLLDVLNSWTDGLDNKGSIDIIYTDLKKAFDLVSHKGLVHKLPAFGIGTVLINWISAFLSGRLQKVRVGLETSSWTPVTSGVPQGSVLGPVLFILYINDLVLNLNNSTAKLFADDAKIFKLISSSLDAINLQTDIDAMVNWAKVWKLQYNVAKCKVLHLGISNQQYGYRMEHDNSSTLQSVTEERDLGVIIDDKLNFDQHIGNIVRKANTVLGLIKRSFRYLNIECFLLLYKSLVRPLLEYSSPVWNPNKVKNIRLLESVQRRATKLVANVSEMSYPRRLKELNLTTLEYRRLRTDIIQIYKIFSGIDDVNYDKFFDLSSTSVTRGHKYKVVKKRCNTNLRKHFFSYRNVDIWNKLPAYIIESDTIETFKTRLDRYWSNINIKYTPSFM